MKQDRALSGDVPIERNRARLALGAGADFPKTFTRKRLIRVPSGNSESSAGVELEKKTAESLGVLRGSSTMANRLLSKPKVSQKTTTTRGLIAGKTTRRDPIVNSNFIFALHSYKVLLDAGAVTCRKPAIASRMRVRRRQRKRGADEHPRSD